MILDRIYRKLERPLQCALVAAVVVGLAARDVLGTKDDPTTAEIFEAGRSDPRLLDEVEYVPLFPFFSTSATGAPFDEPTGVYVGFDQFLYVTDRQGLHVLESSGRPATFVPIEGGATSVIQDRLLNLYVTARRDTVIGARTWNLPVVLKLADVSLGNPHIADIIWHPFDDDTRLRRDPEAADEQVAFTSVAVLSTNSIYVARQGPNNSTSSVLSPHNAVLEFNTDGVNVLRLPLHPTLPSLRSAVRPSAIATAVQPPQRESFPANKDFIVAQAPDDGSTLQFAVLSVVSVETPDGIIFRPDTQKLQVASLPDRGDGFLYDTFRFSQPSGLTIAGDATGYLFVTDAAKDSLYIFTSNGVEGVAPPPGSGSQVPVVVSFGGSGDGAREFNQPRAVAYANQIVYVADSGNNRISRFRLNTDFE